jgi:hypothetical protein
MTHFAICKNEGCRFVLDRRVNGKSLDLSPSILKECPACGSPWSSTCPYCGQDLAIKLTRGVPHTACCNRTLHVEARAA